MILNSFVTPHSSNIPETVSEKDPMSSLFSDSDLRKLEQLMLVSRRVRSAAYQGERRSTRRGTSIEFADFRNYVKGDDLRHLDWNLFARLEKPFIKLFEDEEDLAVYILIDASASMDWPRNSIAENKLRYGLQLAGALSYIALGTDDRVQLNIIGAQQQFGPIRGRGQTLGLLDWLAKQTPTPAIDFNASLRTFAAQQPRPGLVILLSDLLLEDGYQTGLDALLARGNTLTLLQVLSPEELSPQLNGDLRLRDVESNTMREVTVDARLRQRYQAALAEFQAELNQYVSQRGAIFSTTSTAIPWDTFVLANLRAIGVLRG